MSRGTLFGVFFFFNDTATTEIYTLSLHDALPILSFRKMVGAFRQGGLDGVFGKSLWLRPPGKDRKSTRLNSSHLVISYAVFCLKKKTHSPPPRPGTAECPRPARRATSLSGAPS